ncbi:MAG: hypothetical protein ACLQVF_15060 [Isosphaeraceae bacterium]
MLPSEKKSGKFFGLFTDFAAGGRVLRIGWETTSPGVGGPVMSVPVISPFSPEERRILADLDLQKRVRQRSEQSTRREEVTRLERAEYAAHIKAVADVSRDAGAIPAASILRVVTLLFAMTCVDKGRGLVSRRLQFLTSWFRVGLVENR